MDTYSSVQWMGMDGQYGKGSAYGDTKPHSMGITLAFGSRSTAIGDAKYASTFDMPELCDRLQGADCYDKRASCMAELCNIIRKD
ncbi:hypothetical protein DY000_02005490 [Brassica cretica]|uniref:Uncharacterized protein n=1 Tax=Brassica cretica TaxID=69181 RepID=A0ABQ7BV95_BRACR|nr:hypothetical protein DY000_02005490 [Brassica cretica]